MAQGIFLGVGLNVVDAGQYGGWDGALRGCENDARDMASIAGSRGLSTKLLLTKSATAAGLFSELDTAARALVAGDLLVVSYSGHGGQVGDVNFDEVDRLDETWCLYDRMVVDDELFAMWGKFRPGVRILVFSDSCHSGTATKEKKLLAAYKEGIRSSDLLGLYAEAKSDVRFKFMPFANAWSHYQDSKGMYDSLQLLSGATDRAQVAASVILVSGCQDNQLSADGPANGLFTSTLKKVWDGGKFVGDYRKFHKEIVARMPPSQTPNFFTVGVTNAVFEAQQPFYL